MPDLPGGHPAVCLRFTEGAHRCAIQGLLPARVWQNHPPILRAPALRGQLTCHLPNNEPESGPLCTGSATRRVRNSRHRYRCGFWFAAGLKRPCCCRKL